MRKRRKITNLVTALAAMALGLVAQGYFADGYLTDGLVVYGVAVGAFLYAFRHHRLTLAQTSEVSEDFGSLADHGSPWRVLSFSGLQALILLVTSGLAAVAALRLFSGDVAPGRAWFLHLTSVAVFVAAAYLLEETRQSPPAGRPRFTFHVSRFTFYALLLTLAVAAFMRLYRFGSLPYGTWYDEADNGLQVLRILSQPGYWPVYVESTNLPAHFLYLIAVSFGLFGVSTLSIRAVTVAFGLGTVVVGYLAGRELFERRVALTLAFLLAVSRWDVNFSRLGIHGVTTPFFALLTVWLLLRALRTARLTDFAWAGVALGYGLCFYASFRLFPLVVVSFLLAVLLAARNRHWSLLILVFTLGTLLSVAPVAQFALSHPDVFWARTRKTSVFRDGVNAQAWRNVAANAAKHVLMFNYRGDPNGRHNLPGEPELDDVTGVLFVMGLAYSLYRVRQPRLALLVTWWAIMLGAGVFSLPFEAPQSLRAIGALPAAYLLACVPLALFAAEGRRVLGRWAGETGKIALISLLVTTGWLNAYTYFGRQAHDFASWNAFSTAETRLAHEMKRLAGDYELYVDPLLANHLTTQFLAPGVRDYTVFDPTNLFPLGTSGPRGAALFVMPETEAVRDLAGRYYPQATIEPFGPPFPGPAILYTYLIPREDIEGLQGLQGTYYREGGDSPTVRRRDAPLDLSGDDLPSLKLPFHAEWQGVLRVPAYGRYALGLDAPGPAELWLDGEVVLSGPGRVGSELTLARGNHALRVRCRIEKRGPVRLLWREPDGAMLVPVPRRALYVSPVTANGLLGRYYPNADWRGPPAFTQVDESIAKYIHLIPLPRPYTVEWQGQLDVPTGGLYRLGVQVRDAAWLYVDGQLLVENTEPDGFEEAPIRLSRGRHDLRLRFLDRTDHSHIYLYWTRPDGTHEIVPSQYLIPYRGEPEAEVMLLPPPPTPQQPATVTLTFAGAWGERGSGFGQFDEPRGLAVDADGRVYVADTGNRRVQVFDSEGHFLAAWQGGEADFVEPVDVAVDGRGRVLVLDADQGWVYRFDAEGQSLGRFAGPGDELFHPRGLAVDGQDSVYVADTGGNRVVEYDFTGQRVGEFGGPGAGPGQMAEPTDVAVDRVGTIYVVDTGHQRVQRFGVVGGYLGQWPIPAADTVVGPHLAVAADGTLFLTAPVWGQVERRDGEGRVLGQWGATGSGPGQFNLPVGLALDAGGRRLFVADALNHRVQVFSVR